MRRAAAALAVTAGLSAASARPLLCQQQQHARPQISPLLARLPAPSNSGRRQSVVFRAVCLAGGAQVVLKRYSKQRMDAMAEHKMRREVRRE